MANSGNYKLLLEATFDPKTLESQVRLHNNKYSIILKAELDPKATAQFNKAMVQINQQAKSIDKITFGKDNLGIVNKAIVQYTDHMNRAVTATVSLGKKVEITERATQNLAKDAKEVARAYQDAEKFLARASKMNQSDPKVRAAIGIAQELKSVASTTGDIDSIRKLSAELNVAKLALSGINQGVRAWTAGMAQSIKTTIQYSLSVGMLYGVMRQFREGIQYVADLNKELVNIQLVTGDTAENTAKLAVDYNNLAKEMGATTLEVARGSLEFVRQGKTAEETATLIKNSTMMSKLGNMEAAESSEALTSIMNGFKLSAEETGEVVSKLVAIKFVATHSDMWTNYYLDTNSYLCQDNN